MATALCTYRYYPYLPHISSSFLIFTIDNHNSSRQSRHFRTNFLIIFKASISFCFLFFLSFFLSFFSSLLLQIGGIWGGCVEAYQNFSSKWASVLDANMTDDDTLALGYEHWKWGNIAPRRVMVETAVMGEYFHIYRSFWRSHMCAVDGLPHYLKCADNCTDDTPYTQCTCQVDALVSGTC